MRGKEQALPRHSACRVPRSGHLAAGLSPHQPMPRVCGDTPGRRTFPNRSDLPVLHMFIYLSVNNLSQFHLHLSTRMQLSTSIFLSFQSLSARQIEHLIEGSCFNTEWHTRNRPGRMSGVDLRGLDLAYPYRYPCLLVGSDSSPGNLCGVCSEFPAWLKRTDGEATETGGFCLGRLRRVLGRMSYCPLCLVVGQSIELSYGLLGGSFPAGCRLWLVPRGRAMIDVKLSGDIAQHQEVADWSSWPALWAESSKTLMKLVEKRRKAGLQLRGPDKSFQPRYLAPKVSQSKLGSRLRPRRWPNQLSPKNSNPKQLKLLDCHSYHVVQARVGTPYCALRHNLSGVFHPPHMWLNRPSGGTKKFHSNDTLQSWRFLPKPVLEAIYLTLQMGYRYLWVDLLCINLGDGVEKEKQTRQLGNVFSNAEYVFTTDIGKDTHIGLKGIYKVQKHVASHQRDRDSVVMAGAKIGEWVVRPCLSVTSTSLSSWKRGPGLTTCNDWAERPDELNWTWQSLVIQHEKVTPQEPPQGEEDLMGRRADSLGVIPPGFCNLARIAEEKRPIWR